jgi:hypothetical protein
VCKEGDVCLNAVFVVRQARETHHVKMLIMLHYTIFYDTTGQKLLRLPVTYFQKRSQDIQGK